MALKQIQKHYIMNFKFILAAALAIVSSAAFAQEAPEYEFTTVKENPVTSVKNQNRSGTCWCYSALSFIESEILRTKGRGGISLSHPHFMDEETKVSFTG